MTATARRMRKRAIKLPDLPVARSIADDMWYTQEQMKAYAERAVVLDREAIFSRKHIPLREGSISYQIMEVIATGPKTTSDMSRLLKVENPNSMSVYLTNLYKRGYLNRELVSCPREGRHGGVCRWLWSDARKTDFDIATVKW